MEREIYEGRLKGRRDRAAEKAGLILVGQITGYQSILKQPVSSQEELFAMTLEELTQLADALKTQLTERVK